jgi:hypothetical protein
MSILGIKSSRLLLAVLFACNLLICLPHVVGAASPTVTGHKFYGTVHYNGKVVGAGYVVTAMVDGKEMASAITDDTGTWGVAQPFTVAIAGCALVDFYVNGELVGSAASCIETNELNLTAPRLLKASASSASVNSTTMGAGAGTSDVQASAGSADSGSSSLISTTTFFIGPQPSSSSSPSDSSFSQPLNPTAAVPNPPSTDASRAAAPETTPSSAEAQSAVDAPTAKPDIQKVEAKTAPAPAAAPSAISLSEILVISAIVIWSLVIVIMLWMIMRKRPGY